MRRADFKEAGGYAATRALLATRPRPDALFAANNLMTLGALRAITEAGRACPTTCSSSASTTHRGPLSCHHP